MSAALTRVDAERSLTDQDLSTRVAALAFEVEAQVDAGPFGVKPSGAPEALAWARQLETLAGETAAQRPAVARTLRTAAADLRAAAEASGPLDVYRHLSAALALLEQL